VNSCYFRHIVHYTLKTQWFDSPISKALFMYFKQVRVHNMKWLHGELCIFVPRLQFCVISMFFHIRIWPCIVKCIFQNNYTQRILRESNISQIWYIWGDHWFCVIHKNWQLESLDEKWLKYDITKGTLQNRAARRHKLKPGRQTVLTQVEEVAINLTIDYIDSNGAFH